MDRNHGAVGDPEDDDVFGPVEDGEEVFEWIDDEDGTDESDDPKAKQPGLTLRERVAAVRAGGRRLRRSRREITAVAAAVVLACAIGGACTAWFDNVAGAADRAEVVSLAVDSVVNGDPSAASYNSQDSSAVGQYVVEIANNGPDAVTLDSVGVDAGTLMTSTAWKPVGGSRRIPGGGIAEVTLTAKLFCPMVLMAQQTGMFGATAGTGGGPSLAFPALHVAVRDGDGDLRSLTLPTRVATSTPPSANSGLMTFSRPGGAAGPQIVSADAGACSQFTADRAQRLALGGTARFTTDVAFTYVKVHSAASDGLFTLDFTVKNTSDHAVTLTKRADVSFLDDNQLRTDWLPSPLKLAPGASAPAQLTIDIHNCTSVLAGASVLGETMLEVDDLNGSPPQPVFIDQALSGSLRLAADIVQQEKAACS